MSGAGEDKKSQLLAEIEQFSRAGPLVTNEPAKQEIHRESLTFPDLNKGGSYTPKPDAPQTAVADSTPTLEVPSNLGMPAASSLLARLKQQAESLQQNANQVDAAKEALAQRLSDALGNAFHYLDDLVKQLNIIKPAIPKEFVFPGNILFAGMNWTDGAADFRMVPGATDDRRYESLTARFRIASPQKISVDRENLAIEPLRKLLHDYGIAFTVEEKFNARNQPEKARFTFPCEIKSGFIIKADYEAGNLLLRTRNVDRFGMMEFRMQPQNLNQETLDELTKLFLGEKSRFLTIFRRTG